MENICDKCGCKTIQCCCKNDSWKYPIVDRSVADLDDEIEHCEVRGG